MCFFYETLTFVFIQIVEQKKVNKNHEIQFPFKYIKMIRIKSLIRCKCEGEREREKEKYIGRTHLDFLVSLDKSIVFISFDLFQ